MRESELGLISQEVIALHSQGYIFSLSRRYLSFIEVGTTGWSAYRFKLVY